MEGDVNVGIVDKFADEFVNDRRGGVNGLFISFEGDTIGARRAVFAVFDNVLDL